jgi:hypothetical protein
MGRPSLMLQRLALLRQQQHHHASRSTVATHHHHHQQPIPVRPHQSSRRLGPPQQHRRAIATSSHTAAATGEPSGKIGADEDAVAALFDGALGASAGLNDPRRRRVKDPDADRPKLLTARRESLALYREVLRTSNLFVWRDGGKAGNGGALWRDRIRASARGEFEAARGETDPELVTRMIVTARDALHRAVDQFRARRAAIIEDEARRADAGVAAPVAGVGRGGGGGGSGGGASSASSLPSWSEGVPLVRGGGGGPPPPGRGGSSGSGGAGG